MNQHKYWLRRIEALEAARAPGRRYALAWRDDQTLVPVASPAHSPQELIYRRTLRFHRFPSQRVFDELEATFKGFSGPIGSGKSKALCYEAVKCAYRNPGARGLIGAPTERLLAASTVVELLHTLEQERVPFDFRRSAATLRLTEPDCTILLRSLEQPERLRAMNLGWFGVDELTYCKEAAWLRLEGRLRDPQARFKCGFAAWTPKGKDWVWRRFVSARRVPTHQLVRAQPFENRAILDAAPHFYENLRHSYDDRLYEQEVLGEYVELGGGAVYHAFRPERNVRTLTFDPRLPLIWSLDFNVNPMTSLMLQCDHGEVRVLKEIVLPASHTQQMCEEFLRCTKDWRELTSTGLQVRLYGDATGGALSAAARGDSNWVQIERALGSRFGYKVTACYRRANPSIIDRVNAVNGLLQSAAGRVRLVVDPGCRELIADFEEVNWKTDAHGNARFDLDKRDPKRTHASDALGYYCEQEHGLIHAARVIRESPFA
jgi:hypothetical protein